MTATGVVGSSCKTNTISSYGGSSNEAGPVDTTATTATTSSPSATGTTSTPPSRCTPGTKRCPGGATGPVLETCAQDGAWVAENCPSAFPLCKLDKCVEECVPNATRCDGDSTQKCQSDRTWGAATPCPASDPICSAAGTCGKTCGAAGDKRCTGDTIETCDGVRTWGSPLACSGATPKCLNGSPPRCGIIDCTPPGESGCLGTTRRTCNADSTWAAGSPCSGATPACLETPGAPKSAACVECSSGSGCLDARTPKTCVGGAWTPSAACNVGSECKPATGACGACTGSAVANAWTSLATTGQAPTPRSSAAMAHDPSGVGSMLLFGGALSGSSGQPYTVAADTYRLTGSVWSKLAVATSPSARMFHAMATDTSRGIVYLVGGLGPGGVFQSDFWRWNGVEWSELCNTAPCNANKPTFRKAPGLAYDSARDRLVLHAGNGGDAAPAKNLDDTWEWDGAAWSRVCGDGTCGVPTPGPLPGGMAYDTVRQRVVYLTGTETREYDGVSWRVVPGNAAPVFSTSTSGFVFDAARKVSVALASTRGYFDLAVWEWNGACWSSTIAIAPFALDAQTTAYDPMNQRLVRFGGNDVGTPLVFSNAVYVRSSL